MRDFKYKIWDIPNKQWVGAPYALTQYGDLLCKGYAFENMEDFEVCQHTGLKNIYEGDILDDGFSVGVVEYVSRYAAFRLNYQNGTCKWFYDYLDSETKCVEIIGNIYDNPELLQEAQNGTFNKE
jgi:hypothetical protein